MEMDPSGARLSERDAYNELQGYTLGLGDEQFIHQHVVDAWMAQRNRAIHAWCVSVWESYRESRQAVAELLTLHGVI